MDEGRAKVEKAALVECVDDDMAAVLRTKTPAERLAIANDLFRTARLLIEGVVRSEHPDWSESTVAVEVARRISHGAV